MAFLRLANEEEFDRVYYEDTEEFIDLKKEISKKTANGLLKFAPQKENNLEEGLRFIERAFRDIVVGWSLDAPPTVETYQKLDAAAAQWIDRTVGNHVRKVLGVDAQEVEGKLENSDQTLSEESVSNDD